MARGTLGDVEGEGDFASGMGIAIGAVIALFAVGILLFVIGQEQPQAAPAKRATVRTSTSHPTATTPVALAPADRR